MTGFADACRRPFSNGTEGETWMAKWCDHCAHDHGLHPNRRSDPAEPLADPAPMCPLIGGSMMSDDRDFWPEGWLPEPDDGRFFLPSRLVCLKFEPCEPCGGDLGAEARAERVAEVQAYWRDREAVR